MTSSPDSLDASAQSLFRRTQVRFGSTSEALVAPGYFLRNIVSWSVKAIHSRPRSRAAFAMSDTDGLSLSAMNMCSHTSSGIPEMTSGGMSSWESVASSSGDGSQPPFRYAKSQDDYLECTCPSPGTQFASKSRLRFSMCASTQNLRKSIAPVTTPTSTTIWRDGGANEYPGWLAVST